MRSAEFPSEWGRQSQLGSPSFAFLWGSFFREGEMSGLWGGKVLPGKVRSVRFGGRFARFARFVRFGFGLGSVYEMRILGRKWAKVRFVRFGPVYGGGGGKCGMSSAECGIQKRRVWVCKEVESVAFCRLAVGGLREFEVLGSRFKVGRDAGGGLRFGLQRAACAVWVCCRLGSRRYSGLGSPRYGIGWSAFARLCPALLAFLWGDFFREGEESGRVAAANVSDAGREGASRCTRGACAPLMGDCTGTGASFNLCGLC